jgi:hypothetical protein
MPHGFARRRFAETENMADLGTEREWYYKEPYIPLQL